MPTRIGRFPPPVGRLPTCLGGFIAAAFAVGGLSACAVGDGVAHVVKLGVQAAQGSSEPSDHPNTAPQSAAQSTPPNGDVRPGDSMVSPPPLPGSGPVAPVAEESLPPASSAKP